jgi:GntR family transcriptional regulator, carbon starvation induced regulator
LIILSRYENVVSAWRSTPDRFGLTHLAFFGYFGIWGLALTKSNLPNANDRDNATLTSLVSAKLRHDILTGRLRPGERLRLAELSEFYGVGPSPLREALFKLSAERFVATSDRRGFSVSPISLAELNEVIWLRTELERLAVTEAVARGDNEWETNIVATFYRLSKLKEQDGEIWQEAHLGFHEALVAACRSPILHEFRRFLFDLSKRYRNLSLKVSAPDRDHVAEHEAMMKACLARDAELAARLLSEHFALTRKNILSAIDERRIDPAIEGVGK